MVPASNAGNTVFLTGVRAFGVAGVMARTIKAPLNGDAITRVGAINSEARPTGKTLSEVFAIAGLAVLVLTLDNSQGVNAGVPLSSTVQTVLNYALDAVSILKSPAD